MINDHFICENKCLLPVKYTCLLYCHLKNAWHVLNELQYKSIYIIFKLHYVIRYKVKQVYSNHVFVVSEHLKDTD